MAIRPEGIGRTGDFTPRQRPETGNEPRRSPVDPDLRKLTTPQQWLEAAQGGNIGFQRLLANIDQLPEDWQDLVLTACPDKPGF